MSKRFTILTVIFCVCLVASNIFETIIFKAGPLTLTGGFLIFPISYIINDCLSEVYGYKNARFVIINAFCANLVFVLIAQLICLLPEVPYSHNQEAFAQILKADLRITCASMAAFLCGSLVNAKVMVKMRDRVLNSGGQPHKGFCWRAVASSLAGESLDSIIFFPIAFYGVGIRNILTMMVTQIILKTLYEVILLPVTTRVVRQMRTAEQSETN